MYAQYIYTVVTVVIHVHTTLIICTIILGKELHKYMDFIRHRVMMEAYTTIYLLNSRTTS